MAGRRATGLSSSVHSHDSGSVGYDMSDVSSVGVPPQQRSRRKKSSSHKAGATFHPFLILSQMAALQFFHYFILCLLLQVNSILFRTNITLDRIFTDHYLSVWTADGWIDNSAILMSSFTGAILLAVVVEKAKKCLDFSVTMFMIHLVVCTMYGGLPRTSDWWIVHVMHMIIMILLGEFFCARRELRDIPLLTL